MTPRLQLPDAPATTLFRLIVQQIANDPAVRGVVKTMKLWTDDLVDRADLFAPLNMPAVELYPAGGPENFATPDTMLADLFIDVIVSTAGLRIDNLQNLWYAVVRAVRPVDQVAANGFRNKLVQPGGPGSPQIAETGLIRVTRPVFAVKPDAANQAYFCGSGQLAVRYFAK